MLTAEASVTINASPAAVWKALTDPAMIKEYMFGTETTSDWKVGSRITYRGIWQGKEYEDGGTILEIEPGKILKATYWSSMSGTEDKPENYSVVTYSLEKTDGSTKLTVTQDNCKTEESKQHSEGNWNMVLGILKKLLE
jgi:uncharacterized protein YndB with AHSA1/START domain